MEQQANTNTVPEAARFLIVAFAGFLAFGLSIVPRFQAAAAVFVSLVIEAVPFLVGGAIVAAVVERYVTPVLIARLASKLGIAALPVAGVAGLAIPICECAIVPTVRRLREKGLPLPVALTFLLSVPLVNPIVIASTLLAFPDRPDIVVVRFLGGFIIAILVGGGWWLAQSWKCRATRHKMQHSRPPFTEVKPADQPASATRHSDRTAYTEQRVSRGFAAAAWDIAVHGAEEFLSVFRYFVIGAGLSALLSTTIPAGALATDTIPGIAAMVLMMVLAYLLSICSEADAFVARGFLALAPPEAVVCFLIFGPMIDLKNTLLLRRVLSRGELVVLTATVSALVLTVGGVYAALR